MLVPLPPRILDKITLPSEKGCWIWTAASNSAGYGRVWHDGRLWLAHRAEGSVVMMQESP